MNTKNIRSEISEIRVPSETGPPGLRLGPERAARVDALREAIAGGRYHLDPHAIAASLLRRIPWHELA